MIVYKSKIGEIKTHEQWKQWTLDYYNNIDPSCEIVKCPKDWFKRLTKILQLEKIEL